VHNVDAEDALVKVMMMHQINTDHTRHERQGDCGLAASASSRLQVDLSSARAEELFGAFFCLMFLNAILLQIIRALGEMGVKTTSGFAVLISAMVCDASFAVQSLCSCVGMS